jgi:hypothetical protein
MRKLPFGSSTLRFATILRNGPSFRVGAKPSIAFKYSGPKECPPWKDHDPHYSIYTELLTLPAKSSTKLAQTAVSPDPLSSSARKSPGACCCASCGRA